MNIESEPVQDRPEIGTISSDSSMDLGAVTSGMAEELPLQQKTHGKPEWRHEEDDLLRQLVESSEVENQDTDFWKGLALSLPTRTGNECKRRWNLLNRQNKSTRVPWTKEEDDALTELVKTYGTKSWIQIANNLPGRRSKQCRERWTNVIDPSLNYTPWTEEEEQILIQLQQESGNRWAAFEEKLPGRSANSIKNYWYSALRRGIRKQAKEQRRAEDPEGKLRKPRRKKIDVENEEQLVDPTENNGITATTSMPAVDLEKIDIPSVLKAKREKKARKQNLNVHLDEQVDAISASFEPAQASVPVELMEAMEVATAIPVGDETKRRGRKRKARDESQSSAAGSDEIQVVITKKNRGAEPAAEEESGKSENVQGEM